MQTWVEGGEYSMEGGGKGGSPPSCGANALGWKTKLREQEGRLLMGGMLWKKALGLTIGLVGIFAVGAGMQGAEEGGGEVRAEQGVGEEKGRLVRQAIEERRVLRFEYAGHRREVEPHALGTTTQGHRALLAWQTGGGSESEPATGWRTFFMAGILAAEWEEEVRFAGPRPGYEGGRRVLQAVEIEVKAGQ